MRIPAYGHRSCLWGTESDEWSMQYSLFPHIPPNESEHFRQNYLVKGSISAAGRELPFPFLFRMSPYKGRTAVTNGVHALLTSNLLRLSQSRGKSLRMWISRPRMVVGLKLVDQMISEPLSQSH